MRLRGRIVATTAVVVRLGALAAALRRRLRCVAVLLISVPVLYVAGCGNDTEDGGTERMRPAADGQVFEGSGYRVTLPGGWEDATEDAHRQGFTLPEAVLTGEATDGYAVNVTVITERVRPGMSLEEYNNAGRRLQLPVNRKRFRRAGVSPGAPAPPRQTSLDGARAIVQDLPNKLGQTQLQLRGLIALRGKTAYTVTLSAVKRRFEYHLPEFEALLDSWRWT